jgi:hypothetical protein
MAFFRRLEALPVGLALVVDEIGKDRTVAGKERLHVDDEVLQDREAPDGLHRRFRQDVLHQDLARQAVLTVDHHGVGAADPVGARTPKGKRPVLVPLHLVQRVEEPVVGLGVDRELVPPGIRSDVRVVPPDLQRQRNLAPCTHAPAVRIVQHVAQRLFGHQYFRSMGT